MAGNFFTDNPDLAYHLERADLDEIVAALESDYAQSDEYDYAPRNYADAKDSYDRLLRLVGEICAEDIATTAADAADEGVQFSDGQVSYASATEAALERLRQADLMGAMLPRAYGGLNLPQSVFQMMIEMVSRAEAGLMTVFGLQEISATIAEYGDDEMKERLLPRFASGEVTGAMVLTEPDAGSDLGVVQTRADLDDATGEWRLSGVKRFITNGNADVMLVLARSEEGSQDARGLSMFEIETDDTVGVRRIEHKMGQHASPTCEIEYHGTPARLLGKRRFGLIRYAMAMMNGARLAVAAQALGIAEAAYREAEAYADKRIQFGQPIREIPAVYRLLLGMRADLEATRALLYEAAYWVDLKRTLDHRSEAGDLPKEERPRLKRADRLASVLTPLVKYHATEAGNRICYDSMQVLGGAGYMHEFNVERHYRDIRVTSIYEGTSQLQVVAAIGGLLGGSLDELLSDWAAEDYPPELEDLRSALVGANTTLFECAAHLKEQEREVIDYYAVDLVDMAVYLVTGWLALRHARSSTRKLQLARVYVADALPRIDASAARAIGSDPAPFEARESVLSREEP
jgi:hypothetical protein